METQDLLKKVRKIEIKTRGLSSHIFSGEYHSAFKGRGMAFSEVREYVPGDSIRSIEQGPLAQPFRTHLPGLFLYYLGRLVSASANKEHP